MRHFRFDYRLPFLLPTRCHRYPTGLYLSIWASQGLASHWSPGYLELFFGGSL